jgi:AcrR family transcriptional regulator
LTSGDGRIKRRARNREAVIVALLGLVREGNLEPGVEDISERAGVSPRSIFRYFYDLDDLVRAAINHEIREAIPLAAIPEPGVGTLQRRIDSYVETRLNVYAATYQVSRVARFRSGTIPAIDEGLRTIAGLARERAEIHFATELAQPGNAQADFVLDALVVLTSFESYHVHRHLYQHGTERIRIVWNNALHAMLSTPAASNPQP